MPPIPEWQVVQVSKVSHFMVIWYLRKTENSSLPVFLRAERLVPVTTAVFVEDILTAADKVVASRHPDRVCN